MSLENHIVTRDKFEAEDLGSGLAFPCCVCINRHGSDRDEPCNACDHNLNSIKFEDRECCGTLHGSKHRSNCQEYKQTPNV